MEKSNRGAAYESGAEEDKRIKEGKGGGGEEEK